MLAPDTFFEWVLNYGLRILLAMAALAAGRYLANYVRKIVDRLVRQPNVQATVSPTIGRMIVNVVYYGLFGAAIALALIVLGVPVSYVLGLSSIIFILAALALQQSLANVAATVIFFAFQPFRRGEVITTLGKTGMVQEIQLFNTVLFTGDQRIVSLSNSEIQNDGVVNHTRNGIVRNDVTFAVNYETNLARVRQIVLAIIAEDHRIVSEPPPSLMVQELADFGVRLIVYCMSTQPDSPNVSSDLREQIKARFDAEAIPFARQEILVASTPNSSAGDPIAKTA